MRSTFGIEYGLRVLGDGVTPMFGVEAIKE